ncbi:MAG: glycoside hydrolase family 3 C-terminal domain-containing protein [Oscillospiraceae bacterium]|nr:glycoside hydrolase family 3 C-terminal domain-containing protein [Oscillospiraceae bacterium]
MRQFKFQYTTLPIDERVKALLKELTLDEKLLLITRRQEAIARLGIKALKIGTEAARGLVSRSEDGADVLFGEAPTTVFPEPFGLAATFDPDLMHEIGVVAGTEARIYNREGKSSLFLWAPTVDLERDPRWGRTEEGYGEDPFLTGAMTAAYTKGMYGTDKKHACVIPTLKHFYANNHEEDRTCDNASIPAVLKHDYYLKAFECPIKNGGARSVMTAYSAINGVEALCSPEVGELKKLGMLFSINDNWDFVENVTRHKTDACHAETFARMMKNHGADIINDERDVVDAAAREALERGLITEGDIDGALFGMLKARFLLGEFDDYCKYDELPRELLCCDKYQAAALRAAEESIVLLRNRHGILPLDPKEKCAVIGVHADMNFRDWYTGYSDKNPTILDGLTGLVGRDNLVYESGNDIIALRNAKNGFYFRIADDGSLVCDAPLINEQCLLELFEWGDGAVSFKSRVNGKFLSDCGVMKCNADVPFGWEVREKFYLEHRGSEIVLKNFLKKFLCITNEKNIGVSDKIKPQGNSFFNLEVFSSGIDRVSRAITEAQNAIVFCGNYPQIGARETCDRRDLQLPQKQLQLIEEVSKHKENTVIVMVSGFPYSVGSDWGTILHTSHAGPQMGAAVARTLFGKISPAGRCPMTWYSSEKELGDIKDYNIIATESTYRYYNGEPLFPFGHGLSYTAFKYGELSLNKEEFTSGERVEVSFEVDNIGMFDADEVVQLYIKPPRFSSATPKKELKAFNRIHVDKTLSTAVKLSFDVDDLAFWDVNTNAKKLWSGTYEIQVGASSEEIRKTIDIKINAEEYTGLDVTKPVPAAASWSWSGVELRTTKDLQEYALLSDKFSSLVYENCRLNGETTFEITVANPSTKTELVIANAQNGMELARIMIPQTGGAERFETFSAEVVMPMGQYDLKLSANSILCLKSFRLYK